MSDLTFSIPEPLERFVDEQVETGAYPDAAAVLRAALERLQADADAAREARYRALLDEGLADFADGRFEVVDDTKAWLDQRGRRAG